MGYRSDLAIALQPQAVTHFEQACIEVAARPSASFTSPFYLDATRRRDEEDGVLLVWRSCKCYDCAEILQAFRQRIREAGADRPDSVFFSLRLGDSSGDAEEVGDWADNPFDVGISCSLEYDA